MSSSAIRIPEGLLSVANLEEVGQWPSDVQCFMSIQLN